MLQSIKIKIKTQLFQIYCLCLPKIMIIITAIANNVNIAPNIISI